MAITVPTQDDFTALATRVTKLEQRVTALELNPPNPEFVPTRDNTWITQPSDPPIVDDTLNDYVLAVSNSVGLQIVKNTFVDAVTKNVTLLGILNRKVYQQNSDGNFYRDDAVGLVGSTVWTQCADPRIPVPVPTPTPPPTGAFHVVNGAIVDSAGNKFRGRGVNVNYTQVWGNHQSDIGRVNLACLRKAFGPHLNFVRFACWGGMLPRLGDAEVIAWVKSLTDDGFIVMFDLHYSGNAISPDDATANNWFKDWATYYKNNPRVWWATQNEPHGNPFAISGMMHGQYNAIRDTGNTSPILLCTGDPGAEMTGMNPADFSVMNNVAFDTHYYGWIPQNNMGSFSEVALQLSKYKSSDGSIPVECLEFGNGGDSNHRDDNWQYVCAQAVTAPIFAAWHMNWTTETGDCLLGAPYDGSVLTDYGKVVANYIANT